METIDTFGLRVSTVDVAFFLFFRQKGGKSRFFTYELMIVYVPATTYQKFLEQDRVPLSQHEIRNYKSFKILFLLFPEPLLQMLWSTRAGSLGR